jgi:hypothetical protein
LLSDYRHLGLTTYIDIVKAVKFKFIISLTEPFDVTKSFQGFQEYVDINSKFYSKISSCYSLGLYLQTLGSCIRVTTVFIYVVVVSVKTHILINIYIKGTTSVHKG